MLKHLPLPSSPAWNHHVKPLQCLLKTPSIPSLSEVVDYSEYDDDDDGDGDGNDDDDNHDDDDDDNDDDDGKYVKEDGDVRKRLDEGMIVHAEVSFWNVWNLSFELVSATRDPLKR